MLPKQLSKLVPTSHLMTEEEWRGLGVQQSQGWIHYMIHKPGQWPWTQRTGSRVVYKTLGCLFCACKWCQSKCMVSAVWGSQIKWVFYNKTPPLSMKWGWEFVPFINTSFFSITPTDKASFQLSFRTSIWRKWLITVTSGTFFKFYIKCYVSMFVLYWGRRASSMCR